MHFALIALLALAAVASADRGLIVGERQHGDKLIKEKTIDLDFKDLRGFGTVTTTIAADSGFKITQVEVIDVEKKETSATPGIILGGPNETFVSIKFSRELSHGIHYIVKVYGKQ